MRIIKIEPIRYLLLLIFSSVLCAQDYSKPELYVKSGHIAPVYTVAISPDSKLLASGGSDGNIKLWKLETGEEIRNLASHPTYVSRLVFSPDGKMLASLGGNFLALWDVSSGKGLIPLTNGFLDFDELLRNQKDPERLGKLLSARIKVYSVAFNPKKKNIIATGGDDTITFWDFSAAKKIRSIPIRSQAGYVTEINSLAFSPDGQTLISGGTHRSKPIEIDSEESNEITETPSLEIVSFGDLRLWNAETGKEIKTLSGQAKRTVDSVSDIAVSPDGKILVVADDESLKRWDLVSRRQLKPLVISGNAGRSAGLKSIAFSPDGKIILSGDMRGKVNVWNTVTRNELAPLSGHQSWIESIAFSRDGKVIATGSQDGTIKLWNGNTRKENKSLSKRISFYPCSLSPEGVKLVCLSDKTILLWNLANGQQFQLLKGHLDKITSFAFTPDGKILASGSEDKTIKLWDTTTGLLIKQFEEKNLGHVTSLAFSATGEILTAASNTSDSSSGKTSLLTSWDVKSKQKLWSLKNDSASKFSSSGISWIDFSSDKQTLAFSDIGVVKLLDVKTGKELKSLATRSTSSNMIEFSPDGKTLVASELNFQLIKQWDVASGNEIPLPPGKEQAEVPQWLNEKFIRRFNGLNITLRQPLNSISDNTKITLQDADTEKEIVSLVLLNETDWLAITPDGLFDGTSKAWKQAIWRFDRLTFNYSPIESFFNEFFRPGLLKEILDGDSPKAPRDITSLDRRQPQVTISSAQSGAKQSLVKSSALRTQNIQVEVEEAHAKNVFDPKNNAKPQPGGGIRDVRLFRNGLLVKVWRGKTIDELVGKGCAKIQSANGRGRRIVCRTQSVIAEGDNLFTAYAFNQDNVKSTDAELNIQGAASLGRKGTLYILTIGINEYIDPTLRLRFALADIESIGQKLSERQMNIQQYNETRVIKLTDKNATRDNILLALKGFSSRKKINLSQDISSEVKTELSKIEMAQPEDALLIYFSGHGTARCLTDSTTGKTNCDKFYLIPYDGFPTEKFTSEMEWLSKLDTLSISDQDLEEVLETVDTGKLLMIIDACNSGQSLDAEEKRRGPMNSRGLAQLAYEKGMFMLAASQSRSAAWETSKFGHGLLTFALLEGLTKADKNVNQEVIERKWFDFAVQQVPQLQLQMMKMRNDENKGLPDIQKKIEITYVNNDDAKLPPEKRRLQTPRVFYRRELDIKPFVISKPPDNK